ncbi:MAG TPA: hypothetical protein PLV56_09335, partial [Synergistales bacterium]|nr:hypothetical protein [Synergistales bacterium]
MFCIFIHSQAQVVILENFLYLLTHPPGVSYDAIIHILTPHSRRASSTRDIAFSDAGTNGSRK